MTTESNLSPPGSPGRRILNIRVVLVAAVAVGTLWFVVDRRIATNELKNARTYLRQRRDVEAEQALSRYLATFPRDDDAVLMWAQAVVSGDQRTPEEAARLAIEKLETIPDESPRAGEARMREGRLALLILKQASKAEQRLQRSAQLDPGILDTHYLLWKLFDMTERFQFSEPHFWNTLKLTPQAGKAERLREWYVSQFSPSAANADLDRKMGFLKPGALPGEQSDLARLEEFFSSEPDSPMVAAALAQWYLRNRKRNEALAILKGIADNNDAGNDSFFLPTFISALIETGELETAKQRFASWPKGKDGYDYWITAGRISDLVDRDNKAAGHAYDEALKIWPGPVDWPTMHRKSQCSARMGERDRAAEERARSKKVELLMEPEVHQRLRRALADLNSQETALQMIEFYNQLDRKGEAEEWQKVLDELRHGQ